MRIHKLTTTDAFIAFDLQTGAGDAPAAGVVRRAPKVLQDGAKLLARSTTYAFASFELQRGGASAGLNADDDAAAEAIAAFVAEVEPLVASGAWAVDASLGITSADLASLGGVDHRPGDLLADGQIARLTGIGAVAAADAARSGLSGATAAFLGGGPLVSAATEALTNAGASVVEGGLTADCDVLFVAGKAGAVDHELVDGISAGFVVPLTPVPVTARAHAELGKKGIVHVPDFLSTAAPLLAGHDPEGGDPVERVRSSVAALASDGTSMWMTAVERAEAFLKTWQDELPFGRPLA